MDIQINNNATHSRAPFTRTWQPALPRITAPRWGAAEQDVVQVVLRTYQNTLLESPRVMTTLDSNGISREAIEVFQLGFATREAGKHLPKGETHEGALLRGRLQNVGLFRLSGHNHFSGALTAPVFNSQGKVVDVYGRKITPKLRSGSAYHLSLFGPPQGVFNFAGITGSDTVVLCGDLLDALAFWSAGVCNVTTTVGPRGFTDTHMRVFAAFGVKRVVIAFPAGQRDDRIARLISQALDYMEIECAKMALPREVGNASILSELVHSAPLFKQSADELFKEAQQ